jgi:D-alanine-D-alanine ligase
VALVSTSFEGRPLDVAIIQGGPSSEAQVSRSSAQGVAAALEKVGHHVTRIELDPALGKTLSDAEPEVVFPIVHGALGEDGSLQGLLEVLGLPYVGSGVLPSALACNKIAAKMIFRHHGLPVAEEAIVRRGDDLAAAARRVRAAVGRAVVVKPHAQGSAIGVTRIHGEMSDAELTTALELALQLDDAALCERFVVGREVTCGVLDVAGAGQTYALPPTEMVAKLGEFYDFKSRYGQGGADHTCPAALPVGVSEAVQAAALAAHRALGCRDLSRADFVVGDGADADKITLLEVNTLPGMTPTSLFPEAAAVVGISMERLCDLLVRSAHARGARRGVSAIPLPT